MAAKLETYENYANFSLALCEACQYETQYSSLCQNLEFWYPVGLLKQNTCIHKDTSAPPFSSVRVRVNILRDAALGLHWTDKELQRVNGRVGERERVGEGGGGRERELTGGWGGGKREREREREREYFTKLVNYWD